jgi:hypothetical protein
MAQSIQRLVEYLNGEVGISLRALDQPGAAEPTGFARQGSHFHVSRGRAPPKARESKRGENCNLRPNFFIHHVVNSNT